MKNRELTNGRTILVNDDGTAPRLVQLCARPSTTAHGRLKAVLATATEEGYMPLPISSAHVGQGLALEFRLEAN